MNNQWLDVFNAHFINKIETAVILGSGLDFDADYFDSTIEISFDAFEGLPKPTVTGHSAKFIIGKRNNKTTLIQKGRVHFYEGYSMHEVTLNIELFHALGVKNLIITNACGGMNKELTPGDFVILKDFINFMPSNPLVGHLAETTFPDMTEPFDLDLRKTMKTSLTTIMRSIKKVPMSALWDLIMKRKLKLKCFHSLGMWSGCQPFQRPSKQEASALKSSVFQW
jgi:purine-nucleoside phosphorylase